MFRPSPSRNQRSRGMKVKHMLQFCVLLAVCFWLIYQVKHSHDKKKEFVKNSAKFSLNKESSNVVLRLGRKDIQPRVEESTLKKEKHDEEEEETIGEEANKHEEEEQDEENKTEDKEDEGKEGDDEIDEHDLEKSDGELDHEDKWNEDKEKEEGDEKEIEDNDVEGKDNKMETESALEEHDHDGISKNTHEAREEHYKADDASSAVTHDTQTLSTETENGNSDNSKQHGEMNISEQENKLNNTEGLNVGQNMTELKVGDGEMIQNSSPINTTGHMEKGSENLSSESKDDTSSNVTTKEVGDQPGRSNILIETNVENSVLSFQNETETTHALNGAQNATVGGMTSDQDANLQTTAAQLAKNSTVTSNDNSTVSTQRLDIRAPPRELSNNLTNSKSVGSENAISSNLSAKVNDTSGSSTVQINTNTAQNEKSDTSNSTDEVERSSEPLKNENVDVIQDDRIDTNDSSIPLNEQVHTHLDTLPDITSEGSNREDAAAV